MQSGIDNPGYVAFFEALVTGALKLGTLKQEELCKILDVSLSPMREITTLLEAEGFPRRHRSRHIMAEAGLRLGSLHLARP